MDGDVYHGLAALQEGHVGLLPEVRLQAHVSQSNVNPGALNLPPGAGCLQDIYVWVFLLLIARVSATLQATKKIDGYRT